MYSKGGHGGITPEEQLEQKQSGRLGEVPDVDGQDGFVPTRTRPRQVSSLSLIVYIVNR